MIRIFNTVLTKKSASAFGRLRNIRYICLKFFTVIDLRLNNVRGTAVPLFSCAARPHGLIRTNTIHMDWRGSDLGIYRKNITFAKQ